MVRVRQEGGAHVLGCVWKCVRVHTGRRWPYGFTDLFFILLGARPQHVQVRGALGNPKLADEGRNPWRAWLCMCVG